jgi:putative salt-induced outer membrane protein
MRRWPVVLLLFVLPAPLLAQLPTPRAPLASPAKMDPATGRPAAQPRQEGSVEFSFVGTTGNSPTQTIGLGGQLIVRPSHWVVTNRATFVRNESKGTLKAQSLLYVFRSERTLNTRTAMFGEYDYLRDEFAGVRHRHVLLGGVSVKFVDQARQLFYADAGLGYLDERRVQHDDVTRSTFAFGAGYRLKFSATAELTEDVRSTGSFDAGREWRLSQAASVSARLTRLLSLKVSHSVRYTSAPVAGFESTDTTTSIALVARF